MQLSANKPVLDNHDNVFFCRSGYQVKFNDDIWILKLKYEVQQKNR